jgi:2',3'-cyclic-nucleotide 2'-phosphodiesterase (5'-nucleotidase family)
MKRVDESQFEWLGSNVVDSQSGKPILTDTKVVRYGSVRVGYFGVCTCETPNISYPGETIRFVDVKETAKRCVDYLRDVEKVDVVVCLSHLRMAQDRSMARVVPGMSLVLGGHDHNATTMQCADTLVHKSGQNAEYLGRVDMFVTPRRKRANAPSSSDAPAIANSSNGVAAAAPDRDALVLFQWHMLLNGPSIGAHEASAAVLARYVPQSDDRELRVLSLLAGTHILDSRSFQCRTKETTAGNLVSNALREAWGTQIGLINGGFIRGDRIYLPGDRINTRNLDREFPFPGGTCRLEIRGQDLVDALEQQLRHAPDSFGGFGQCSGLRRHYDVNAKPLRRLSLVQVESGTDKGEWTPIEPDTVYSVALTEFMATGGDGNHAFERGTIVSVNDELTVRVAVQLYLEKRASIELNLGRTVVIQ